jgi:hypothetical protein
MRRMAKRINPPLPKYNDDRIKLDEFMLLCHGIDKNKQMI